MLRVSTKHIIQEKRYCIYSIECPILKRAIYIGYSKNVSQRFGSHWSRGHNPKPKDVFGKHMLYLRLKLKPPILVPLGWTDDLKEAVELEKLLIRQYEEKYPLYNKSNTLNENINKILN